MKKKRRLLLSSLLLVAVGMMAEVPSPVPAMIVHGIDGSRQVVLLDATDITDLVVSQNGKSLSVDIPEAQISGIRSIAFAMVEVSEVPTAIERTESPLIRRVEKVLRDGQVFIRLQMQSGTILEYDIRGNQVLTTK